MVSYVGRHAELYDVFYADKPYRDEADFVRTCLETLAQRPVLRILELACGTGAHALLLEQFGFEIVALDSSEDMLARAREKASSKGSRVTFELGDMRRLKNPGSPFDAVICLFDSIGYVQTDKAVLDVLRGVRAQLHPGGIFIFEFWHAAAMLRNYDPVRVRKFSFEDSGITRVSETRLDRRRHLGIVTYTIRENRSDGSSATLKEVQTNRYFRLEEMSAFLSQAGLMPVKWFSGFRDDENVGLDTWHVVAVAQRASDE